MKDNLNFLSVIVMNVFFLLFVNGTLDFEGYIAFVLTVIVGIMLMSNKEGKI
jgi:hypothetical protein